MRKHIILAILFAVFSLVSYVFARTATPVA